LNSSSSPLRRLTLLFSSTWACSCPARLCSCNLSCWASSSRCSASVGPACGCGTDSSSSWFSAPPGWSSAGELLGRCAPYPF
jgi:hypothetical protein